MIALISHASKVMLKIVQARLQQYVNHELPDVQVSTYWASKKMQIIPTKKSTVKLKGVCIY